VYQIQHSSPDQAQRAADASSLVGVIADTGIDLAPIGASRETLTADDHWQATITEWMANARLIVVGAAPEAIHRASIGSFTQSTIKGCGSKTLLVLPSVPDIAICARWEKFTKVFTDTAMGCHLITLSPHGHWHFLVLWLQDGPP
jgi:hypothetical protein